MRYHALIFSAGDSLVAEFPDCPGCVAVAGPVEDIGRNAATALRQWLEAQLLGGATPPLPSRTTPKREGAKAQVVPVPPLLGLAVAVRHARHSQGLTVAAYARVLGVAESQVSRLEHPAGDPTPRSIQKAAKAVGLALPKSVRTRVAQGELFSELVSGALVRAAAPAVAAYEGAEDPAHEFVLEVPAELFDRIQQAARAEGVATSDWLLAAANEKLVRAG